MALDSWSQEMFAAAVCKLLRDSRRRQKLTQAQVAARTGGLISKAALANYETGHRSLRVDVLWVIVQALGENMSTLINAAERGLHHRGSGFGGESVTLDLARLRDSQDQRLAPVRRWVALQVQPAATGGPDLTVLDEGALAALSSLMGMTVSDCRQALGSVAHRAGVPA